MDYACIVKISHIILYFCKPQETDDCVYKAMNGLPRGCISQKRRSAALPQPDGKHGWNFMDLEKESQIVTNIIIIDRVIGEVDTLVRLLDDYKIAT